MVDPQEISTTTQLLPSVVAYYHPCRNLCLSREIHGKAWRFQGENQLAILFLLLDLSPLLCHIARFRDYPCRVKASSKSLLCQMVVCSLSTYFNPSSAEGRMHSLCFVLCPISSNLFLPLWICLFFQFPKFSTSTSFTMKDKCVQLLSSLPTYLF